MSEVTVRKQKLRKSTVKMRLIIFGARAVLLVVCSFFSAYLTPYDPYLQDLSIAKQAPSAQHLLGTDRYGWICCPVSLRAVGPVSSQRCCW